MKCLTKILMAKLKNLKESETKIKNSKKG